MSVKLVLTIISILLIAIMFSLCMVQFVVWAEVVRMPGASVGDWVKYGISASWSPERQPTSFHMFLNNTEWVLVTVQTVSATNITCEVKWHFRNGTEQISQDWTDVSMGSNPSGWCSSFLFFISADLQAGDSIYSSDNVAPGPPKVWKIDETTYREYLGVGREINHINSTGEKPAPTGVVGILAFNHYWDKATGVLMEHDVLDVWKEGTIEKAIHYHFEIIDSNIAWTMPTPPITPSPTPTSPTPAPTQAPISGAAYPIEWSIAIVAAIVIVIVIVALILRRRK